MFTELQIAMPRPVRSLSYNHFEGYIACGGDDGVLKVVKLDAKIGNYFFGIILFSVLLAKVGAVVLHAWMGFMVTRPTHWFYLVSTVD